MSKSKALHHRNRHLGAKGAAYDLPHLCAANPGLSPYIQTAKHGGETIDFSNDLAVKELNKSLLMAYYKVQFWDLPEQFLCPPVPGRADYIHYLADLLQDSLGQHRGSKIKGLDIGTGANLIYPIVGHAEYDWRFVGSDIDKTSVKWTKQLLDFNPNLKSAVKVRMQSNSSQIFAGIIKQTDRFAFSMCNPPFHRNAEEAEKGSRRKARNLNQQSNRLNFGGRSNELWCEGGELQFINNMVDESQMFQQQVLWFTTLVSKKEHLSAIYQQLKTVNAQQVKTIDMAQGNKVSRFVAWSFVPESEHSNWL